MHFHRLAKMTSLAAPLAAAFGVVGCGTDSHGLSSSGSAPGTATSELATTVACSGAPLIERGTLGGSSSNVCTALTSADGKYVSWEPHSPPTSAVLTYASPVAQADVTRIDLIVRFRGDDKTEPLWQWYAKNVNGSWDRIGDNSWAGNWVFTNHTFTLPNPKSYVAANGTIQIRFTSATSTNSAELDQMVVSVTGGAADAGADATIDATADAANDAAPDTTSDSTADTRADSTADSTADSAMDAANDTGAASDTSGDAADSGGGTFVDIYDPNLVPKFEITLDAAAVTVFSNPDIATKDTWVHGSFKYGDIVFPDVGVRRKGESTFRAMPQKVALKIKFDKYVKGLRFMGLTDLTLNNEVSDPTSLEERLGYHVFRSVGLPAQRANTAEVWINGENYGVHTNVETPDQDFLARVFGAKSKTLYEQSWGSEWLPGSEDGFDVKVGDATKADLTLLFQTVAAARPTSLLVDVAPRLDVDRFLDHCAVEAAIGDIDGYAYAKWGSGNYYLAGDTSGVFSMVPWSLDQSFNDREGVVNAASPKPADPSGGDTLLMRCKANASCWATYKSHVQAVLTKYESLDLVNLAKRWHAQIDALVLADPKKEASNADYASETNMLYTWLAARPALVRKQLGLP